jgi:hypothetical protein
MAEPTDDREWLEQLLRSTSVVDDAPIGPATEIYYDLRISGFDMDEVIATAARRCGAAELSLEQGRYAPGEPGDWFDWLFKSPKRRRYKSLTVAKVLDAMTRTRAVQRPG